MSRSPRKSALPPRIEALLRAREQALEDVACSGAAEVIFVRHDRPSMGDSYVESLLERAGARRFAVAEVPLFADRGFDSFDALVRAVARSVGDARGAPDQRGLVRMLDAFVAKRGARAGAVLSTWADREGAAGDLTSLAVSYVDAAAGTRREGRRIDEWLSGTEVRGDRHVLSTLGPRTAKRALGELSRLVRALGYRGTLIVFTGGEAVTKLPDARRRDTYTVLRELVDNADGGRGLVATEIVILGGPALFEGTKSMASLVPLHSRTSVPRGAALALPPPHRGAIWLDELSAPPETLPEVTDEKDGDAVAMTGLLRASHGLPPLTAVPEVSVGYAAIDETIDKLFSHSAMQGSVFQLLTGAYGSGKTHLLLHLAARALADRRPVVRLAIEKLDTDLGAPQRHLRRLLEDAVLPLPGLPSLLDRLAAWTRSDSGTTRLLRALRQIATEEGDAAALAQRAVSAVNGNDRPGEVLEGFLGAGDLETKPSQPSYRAAAYARLLLWFALLERMDELAGPVVLIDEAENLYRGGVSRAERRTALRSLAFYCGGALPRACVVLAITEEAADELRAESDELIAEIDEQKTLLTWEDSSMLARRLRSARAIAVPALSRAAGPELAAKVRTLHERARGKGRDPGFDEHVASLTRGEWTPRELVRGVVDRLETSWWYQG